MAPPPPNDDGAADAAAAPRRPPPSSVENDDAKDTDSSPAVLLFYCYCPLTADQQSQLAEWYRAACARLRLHGRARVARDGVNATLGGGAGALRLFARAHLESPPPPGLTAERVASIDFKLQLQQQREQDGAAAASEGGGAGGGGGAGQQQQQQQQQQQHHNQQQQQQPHQQPRARRRTTGEEAHFCPSMGVQIRLVDELVTFGGLGVAVPLPPPPSRTPPPPPPVPLPGHEESNSNSTSNQQHNNDSSFPSHLSPEQFHAMLEAASRNGGRDPSTGNPLTLLDCRNAYETALGAFRAPSVPTLDPRTRRLADLPDWIDAHERLLARTTVLAYCTGGVRCERASAMLRARGRGFGRVAQLEGGIQRYLEAFPDGGGFFEGANFVFDGRGHVGPTGEAPEGEGGGEDDDDGSAATATAAAVGRCLACGRRGGSYAARARCARCRMLLLLCPECSALEGEGGGAPPPCALCAASAAAAAGPPAEPRLALLPASRRRRPLHLLCLHGFRSTAGQLGARLRPLEIALEGVAELTYANAPHSLPLWYRPRPPPAEAGAAGAAATGAAAAATPLPPPFPKRAWLASARVLAAAEEAALSGLPLQWEPAPAWLDEEEAEEKQQEQAAAATAATAATAAGGRASSLLRPRGAAAWQDRGWDATVAAVAAAGRAAEASGRPFDGALGFSQGAAVVAGLLALRRRRERGRRSGDDDGDDNGDDGQSAADERDEREACAAVGRFAVLICGFAPAAPRPLQALEALAAEAEAEEEEEAARTAAAASSGGGGPSSSPPSPPPPSSSPAALLQVPSLHVFPAEGASEGGLAHACVPGASSWALAQLFEPSRRAVLRLHPSSSSSSSGGGGGAGEGEAATAAPPAPSAAGGKKAKRARDKTRTKGAQMLPITAPRIARVRQFLLDVALPVLTSEEEERGERR